MMKNISIKEIDKKLSSFNSITEKLEYWVKNKDYVEDKYLSKMQWLLFMPEELFNNHFPNALETPEYTFFVLKYHAKKYFNSMILQDDIKGIVSNKVVIKKSLEKIDERFEKAIDLKKRNFSEEEVIKAFTKHYERNPFNSRLTERAVHYAANVYLKEYYERELKRIENDNQKPIIGFDTKLDEEQRKKIYKKLNNKVFKCSKSDFDALCTEEELSKPIDWILETVYNGKIQPHKSALFTFVKKILLQNISEDSFPNKYFRKMDELFSYKGDQIFKGKTPRPSKIKQKSSIHKYFNGLS